jgi:ABC-type glycerol-3-phosphate transport system substrate-binding protein
MTAYLELSSIKAFMYKEIIDEWIKENPGCKWDETFFNGKMALVFDREEDKTAFRLKFGL